MKFADSTTWNSVKCWTSRLPKEEQHSGIYVLLTHTYNGQGDFF
jgi:hypothetical protein